MYGVESVRIRNYSGPYSVRMRKNTDQNNSEYGHFLRSDKHNEKLFEVVCCVCSNSMTLYDWCLLLLSPYSLPQLFQNIGEFGVETYFTDPRTARVQFSYSLFTMIREHSSFRLSSR